MRFMSIMNDVVYTKKKYQDIVLRDIKMITQLTIRLHMDRTERRIMMDIFVTQTSLPVLVCNAPLSKDENKKRRSFSNNFIVQC